MLKKLEAFESKSRTTSKIIEQVKAVFDHIIEETRRS